MLLEDSSSNIQCFSTLMLNKHCPTSWSKTLPTVFEICRICFTDQFDLISFTEHAHFVVEWIVIAWVFDLNGVHCSETIEVDDGQINRNFLLQGNIHLQARSEKTRLLALESFLRRFVDWSVTLSQNQEEQPSFKDCSDCCNEHADCLLHSG